MKIDVDAINCITKLMIFSFYKSMPFRFEIRTNYPGVGADQAQRGIGS